MNQPRRPRRPVAAEGKAPIAAVRRSERRLARAESFSGVGSWEWDLDSDTIEWSAHAYEIFGLDPTTYAPDPGIYTDLFHPDDRELVRRRIGAAVSNGTPLSYEARIPTSTGEERHVRVAGDHLGGGGRRVLAGTVRDVTGEQRGQAQLEAYAIQQTAVAELGRRLAGGLGLNELIETLVQQVAVVLDARWVEVLEAAPGETYLERRAGLGWDDAAGSERTERGSLSPAAAAFDGGGAVLIRNLVDDGRFIRPEIAGVTVRSGVVVPIETATPALLRVGGADRFGVLAAYRTTQRDVTRDEELFLESVAHVLAHAIARSERDRLAAQAFVDQQLAAVGQLAATVAHDFNNLMTVVNLSAEMISAERALSASGRSAVEAIRRQGEVAASMMWQVLDFAKRAVSAPMPVDVAATVEEAAATVRRALPSTITIAVTGKELPGVVMGDEAQLQRVWINLLTNARDSLGSRPGAIAVTLDHVRIEDGIPASESPGPGSWAHIVVTDAGTGIRPDILPRIFEPFFTTKEPGGGTGLGLAHAQGVITAAGGLLALRSELGKGTRVEVWLPTFGVVTSPGEPSDRIDFPRGNGQLVLVVDDDDALRTLLMAWLRRLGYRVLDSADGVEALCVIDQHPEVSLVLAGVLMPDLGGEGLARVLRERWARLPVVLMSGRKRAIVLEHNIRAVLAKPLNLADVARVVRNEMGSVNA